MKRKFFLNLVSKRSFHGEDIAEVAVEKRNFLKSSSPCGTPQLLLELIKTFFILFFFPIFITISQTVQLKSCSIQFASKQAVEWQSLLLYGSSR